MQGLKLAKLKIRTSKYVHVNLGSVPVYFRTYFPVPLPLFRHFFAETASPVTEICIVESLEFMLHGFRYLACTCSGLVSLLLFKH